jgi:hypothetical protein
VSGLESEFPGQVKAENLDATTAESVKAMEGLGFKSHGLVIRSSKGKVLWKEADHTVKMDDVRAAIQDLLKKEKHAS